MFQEYKDRILRKYGFEFYRDEVNQPYKVGGWLPSSCFGVDTTLVDY